MKAAHADALVSLAAHPVAWPMIRGLRRLGPTVRVPGLGLVVNDAALVRDVLVRDAEFTKNGPGSLAAQMTEVLGPHALANMDGPAHLALRGRIAELFSAAGARRLLSAFEAPLARLQDDLRAGRTIDLARFMRVLSGRVTFDMLGVTLPAGDGDEACLALFALGVRIAASLSLRVPSARALRAVRADHDRLTAHARTGWDAAAPSDVSLMSNLRQQGLTFEEARGVISLVFLAGTITTAASLPRIVALLADSGQLSGVRDRADGVARAVAEGLRFISPVPVTVRVAARDAALDGRRIGRGTRLVLLTCNAARDAALFPDPDRFDATRAHDPRARHLWFGAGVHFCLGFAVAQRELQMVLQALVAAPGTLVIEGRRRGGRALIPAYARLDIRLVPEPA